MAVASSGLGEVLVNGKCAAAWPALTVTGAATPGMGVHASLLSTAKQANGSTRVTYGAGRCTTSPATPPPGTPRARA